MADDRFKVLYLSYNTWLAYYFDTEDAGRLWDEWVTRLKMNSRMPNRTHRQFLDWLADAHRFHEHFGCIYVPPDVRAAINDVERGTSQPITCWD